MPVDRALNIKVLVMRSLDDHRAASASRHGDLGGEERVEGEVADTPDQQPKGRVLDVQTHTVRFGFGRVNRRFAS